MTRKKPFFEGWFWFQLNTLRHAQDMALKFHSSMAKWLKVKVRKFGDRPIPSFVEVTGGKLVGGGWGREITPYPQ